MDKENDAEKETLEENNSPIDVNSNENEDGAAEVVAFSHEEEHPAFRRATDVPSVEETATCEPKENSGKDGLRGSATSKDLDVKTTDVDQKTLPHDQSVDFEIGSSDDNEPSGFNSEAPERETPTPAQEEEEEATAAAAEDIWCEESVQLLQELCKQRDEASQQSRQLQMKLAEYLSKRTRDDSQLGREKPVTEQLQEYETCINILNDLKQQLYADSESVQRQAEELRSQSQDKLDKVGVCVIRSN